MVEGGWFHSPSAMNYTPAKDSGFHRSCAGYFLFHRTQSLGSTRRMPWSASSLRIWSARAKAMIFKNRENAGRQLAKRLGAYANREDVTVLGIPRGGVTVAFKVAQALNTPLDIFLSRKLGVPGHEEFAFGAIAAGDGRYLDAQIIRATGISEDQI